MSKRVGNAEQRAARTAARPRRTGMRRGLAIALAALGAVLAAATADATPHDLFPRPPGIHDRIALWTRVYAEVDTNGGLIHDAEDLGVVYEVIRWPKSLSGAEEERRI